MKSATMKDSLFCDMETDGEKSNFFLCGRGYETGVIAHAIQSDVSMAYHRCDGMAGEIKSLESHLTAIAAALGCPDAEPGELAGMVKGLKTVHHDLNHRYVVDKRRIAALEKERDELRAKLESIEGTAEYWEKINKSIDEDLYGA